MKGVKSRKWSLSKKTLRADHLLESSVFIRVVVILGNYDRGFITVKKSIELIDDFCTDPAQTLRFYSQIRGNVL